MRCRASLLLLPALLAACGGPAIETPQQALAAAQEALLAHRTMAYDAAYTIKFFDDEPGDTTRVWAHVKLLRDTTDTIFGGRLWFATRDSLVRYYDLVSEPLNEYQRADLKKKFARADQLNVRQQDFFRSVLAAVGPRASGLGTVEG
jgi:hypothetical protein